MEKQEEEFLQGFRCHVEFGFLLAHIHSVWWRVGVFCIFISLQESTIMPMAT